MLSGQYNSNDIQRAVEFLSDEGHLYSTVDEHTYKCTTS